MLIGLVSGPAVLAHEPTAQTIETLSHDLEEAPSAAVLLRRARVAADAGRLEDALEAVNIYLTAAGTIGNDRALGERVLGRVYGRLGNVEAAAAAFERAASSAHPSDPADYFEPAAILRPVQPASALAILDRGIGALGELLALQATAIDLAAEIGDWDDALRRVDRVLETAPRRERWLAERGRFLRSAGRLPEAWVAFSAALAELDRLTTAQRSTPAMLQLEQELHEGLKIPPPSETDS